MNDGVMICTEGTCTKGAVEESNDYKAASLEANEVGGQQKPTSNNETKKNKKEPASVIKRLHTQQEVDALLLNDDLPTIVEFVTTWCGACKSIDPSYEELTKEHIELVNAAKVVCDKNKETKKLAAAYGVKSYPVFILFDESGKEVGKWNGADQGKLEKAFEKFASSTGGGRKKKKGGRSSKR